MNVSLTELIGFLLSISFTLWAAVVGFGIRAFLKRIDNAAADLHRLEQTMNDFVLATRTELTSLNERHKALASRVHDLSKTARLQM